MTDHFLGMKQDDLLPACQIVLSANGQVADLTGATTAGAIKLHIRMDERPDDEDLKVDGTMTIVGDPEDGTVRYEWADGDTDRAGGFTWEVEATYDGSPDRPATFPNGVNGYPGAIRPQLG